MIAEHGSRRCVRRQRYCKSLDSEFIQEVVVGCADRSERYAEHATPWEWVLWQASKHVVALSLTLDGIGQDLTTQVGTG